jgi:hypothetical protein
VDPAGKHSNKGDAPPLGSVALAFCTTQLLLHVWAALAAPDPRMLLMHAIAFVYDVFLLSLATVVLRWLWRRVPAGWRRAAGIGTATALLLGGLVLTSYPLLLTEFLGFPVNVFSVASGVTGFFLTGILGWRGAGVMAGAAALALLFWRRRVRIVLPQPRLLSGTVTVLCLVGVALGLMRWPVPSIQPHPLVYSAQETLKGWLLRGRRIVPSPARPAPAASPVPPAPSPLEAVATCRYDHVVLLVMETVNEAHFTRSFLT